MREQSSPLSDTPIDFKIATVTQGKSGGEVGYCHGCNGSIWMDTSRRCHAHNIRIKNA